MSRSMEGGWGYHILFLNQTNSHNIFHSNVQRTLVLRSLKFMTNVRKWVKGQIIVTYFMDGPYKKQNNLYKN